MSTQEELLADLVSDGPQPESTSADATATQTDTSQQTVENTETTANTISTSEQVSESSTSQSSSQEAATEVIPPTEQTQTSAETQAVGATEQAQTEVSVEEQQRQQIEALQQQLDAFAKMLASGGQSAPVAGQAQSSGTTTPASSEQSQSAVVSAPQQTSQAASTTGQQPKVTLTPEQHMELLSDPEKFGAFMSNIVQKAREDALTSIMPVVAVSLREEVRRQAMADDFFRSNPDLVQHKQLVGGVVMQVQGAHPDWDDDKVLSEALVQVRRVKPAPKQTTAVQPGRPAFAGGVGASRTPASKSLTGAAKLIEDLIS